MLVSETSSANHRGGFLGYVFIANCEQSIRVSTVDCAVRLWGLVLTIVIVKI